ncbi:MAG: RtcB family protein, partial [bacterium]|nr:RtcB family protein [bacterium]
MKITKLTDYKFKIEKEPDMNVEAIFYTSQDMLEKIEEKALQQLKNVTTLPGIVKHALAMPDIHWGYGFPVGGVAGFDIKEGVISPGGIGYDISCGVRLLGTEAKYEEVKDKIKEIAGRIFNLVPSGVGEGGEIKFSKEELKKILINGSHQLVSLGY